MSSEAVIAEQTYLLWSLCPCAQPHLVGLIPREESVSWPVLYKGIRREGHGSEASTGTRMQRQWFWAFFYKKGGDMVQVLSITHGVRGFQGWADTC